MQAQLKVSRAVTKSAFSHPFFGSCMLRLKVEEDENIPTACTNGEYIKWNREFIDELSEDETVGLLAHEVMHVVLQHCEDHGPNYDDHTMCNIAMDIAINHTLTDNGFKLPEGGVPLEDRFRNMAWRDIYNIIKDEDEYQGMAGKWGLEDVIENSNMSDAEKEELRDKIKQMTIQAAEAAQNMAPGSVPGEIERLIKEIRTSKVDWKEYLAATMQSRYPEDYTMNQPNKKFLSGYDLYLPSMMGTSVGTIAVHIDSSGSVHKDELEQFLGELNEISAHYLPEQVIILTGDAAVAAVTIYDGGEEITDLDATGGGGTSFAPSFQYLEENDIVPDQMLVFSDMEVWKECFPEKAPDYPVLFISTRDWYDVPFGECITTKGK